MYEGGWGSVRASIGATAPANKWYSSNSTGASQLQQRDCCAGCCSCAAVMGMLMPRGIGAGSSSPCCDSSRRLRTMPWI